VLASTICELLELNFGFNSYCHSTDLAGHGLDGRLASNAGARLLQFHLLEIAGRAEEKLATMCPEEDVMAKAYLMAFAFSLEIQRLHDHQVDLMHAEEILATPDLVYAGDLLENCRKRRQPNCSA